MNYLPVYLPFIFFMDLYITSHWDQYTQCVEAPGKETVCILNPNPCGSTVQYKKVSMLLHIPVSYSLHMYIIFLTEVFRTSGPDQLLKIKLS